MNFSKRLIITIDSLRALLPAIFLMALVTGCDKESAIGLDVQPENDKVQLAYEDSTSVTTYTQKRDSILTDGTLLNVLGSYNDPVFGKSTASIYTQFNLPNNSTATNLGTKDSLVVDSLVLSLAYDPEYYGSLEAQTVKVYELTEDMIADEAYYSNRTLTTNTTELGALTFTPAPTDCVQVGNSMQVPQLRIDLSGSDLADRILAASGTDDLSSTENFQNFFKGVYIVPENAAQTAGTGAVLYFDLVDAASKLTLYYHDISVSNAGDYTFDMEIGVGSSRFTHYDHDYTGTVIENQLNDASLGQQWTYVQSMSGVTTILRFPHLMNWIDSGAVSVNKAEVVMKLDPATIDTYFPPSNVVLTAIDSIGTSIFIPDQFEGENYYGGAYDASAHEYKINIARYIQQVLNGTFEDNGLYLLPAGGTIKGNRAVFGGGDNATYNMELRLTLTKVQ